MKPRPSAVGSSTPMAVSWSVTSAAPFKITIRHMSKHLSKSATKRLPLSTKRAGKGYYKGKGATTEGHINSTGKFILNPQKRLELVVPDLEGFQVSLSNFYDLSIAVVV